MTDLVLSILMLAGIALIAGGIYLIIKKKDHKRGLLMIIAALVMFMNVAIWLIPTPQDTTLSKSGISPEP